MNRGDTVISHQISASTMKQLPHKVNGSDERRLTKAGNETEPEQYCRRKYSGESCGGGGKLLAVPPSRPAPITGSDLTGEHLLVAGLTEKLRRTPLGITISPSRSP